MRREPHRHVAVYTVPGCSKGVVILTKSLGESILAISAHEAEEIAEAIAEAARELRGESAIPGVIQ